MGAQKLSNATFHLIKTKKIMTASKFSWQCESLPRLWKQTLIFHQEARPQPSPGCDTTIDMPCGEPSGRSGAHTRHAQMPRGPEEVSATLGQTKASHLVWKQGSILERTEEASDVLSFCRAVFDYKHLSEWPQEMTCKAGTRRFSPLTVLNKCA